MEASSSIKEIFCSWVRVHGWATRSLRFYIRLQFLFKKIRKQLKEIEENIWQDPKILGRGKWNEPFSLHDTSELSHLDKVLWAAMWLGKAKATAKNQGHCTTQFLSLLSWPLWIIFLISCRIWDKVSMVVMEPSNDSSKGKKRKEKKRKEKWESDPATCFIIPFFGGKPSVNSYLCNVPGLDLVCLHYREL